MFVFQVCGSSHSGKTTLISGLIPLFKKDNLQVATIKNIHAPEFRIDTEGKDTYIHHQSGAEPVIARGLHETDFLYHRTLSLMEIAEKVTCDWLIVEGMQEFPLPRIVCGKELKDLDDYIDDRTFLISGPISEKQSAYRNIPVISNVTMEGIKQIYNAIRNKVFPMLPFTDCGACGMTCAELEAAIMKGEKTASDCQPSDQAITVKIGGEEIPLNPFVEKVLRNTVLGILKELRGFKPGKRVDVSIG